MYSSTLFLTLALEGGEGSGVTPRPQITPGRDPVPVVQEAGWALGPVWIGAENLAPPPGFDPRTIQPVGSRYTDYTTRPTEIHVNKIIELRLTVFCLYL